MFAVPVFAAATLAIAAPAAHAIVARQVYGQFFYGPPSVTVPECDATGTTLRDQGRFDFYQCVTLPPSEGGPNIEELEGFLITG